MRSRNADERPTRAAGELGARLRRRVSTAEQCRQFLRLGIHGGAARPLQSIEDVEVRGNGERLVEAQAERGRHPREAGARGVDLLLRAVEALLNGIAATPRP